jgi:hypothetical protein
MAIETNGALREEVRVIQKEPVDRTFEDHHLYSVVVFKLRDDLSDLQHKFRPTTLTGGFSSTTRECEGVTRSSLTCAATVAEGVTLLLLD